MKVKILDPSCFYVGRIGKIIAHCGESARIELDSASGTGTITFMVAYNQLDLIGDNDEN